MRSEKRLKWFDLLDGILTGLVLAWLLVALWGGWQWSHQPVRDVRVSGPWYFVDSHAVARILDEIFWKEFRVLAKVSWDTLEKRLSRLPGVERVRVGIDEIGQVDIRIQERNPVLQILWQGRILWMDAEGKLFRLHRAPPPVQVPLVKVESHADLDSLRANASYLHQVLGRFDDLVMWFRMLRYERGEWKGIYLLRDIHVRLGSMRQLVWALERWKHWLSTQGHAGVWIQVYREVDLRFSGMVVARKTSS